MESATNTGDKQVLMSEDRNQYLSGAPRSGELSPYAQKIAAEAFVCLCSMVVFGSTSNFSMSNAAPCTSLCRFAIAAGVISFIMSAIILISQYLAWTNRVDKTGWFSLTAEKNGMIFLTIWWIIGVSVLSALEPSKHDPKYPVPPTTSMAILFGWLALFASIFCVYKSYHVIKEEQRNLHYAQVMSLRAAEDEEYANFS